MLRLFPASPSSRVRRPRRAPRLVCAALEARQLLSNFTVTDGLVDSTTMIGSLRWAITQATTTPGDNTVTFDPNAFDRVQTITLTAGELNLTDTSGTVTVTGPGANVLTISGDDASRVFSISSGEAVLSGMTITGGSATSGGGVANYQADLSLTDVTVSGNTANLGAACSIVEWRR
jgi:hypothetical protein